MFIGPVSLLKTSQSDTTMSSMTGESLDELKCLLASGGHPLDIAISVLTRTNLENPETRSLYFNTIGPKIWAAACLTVHTGSHAGATFRLLEILASEIFDVEFTGRAKLGVPNWMLLLCFEQYSPYSGLSTSEWFREFEASASVMPDPELVSSETFKYWIIALLDNMRPNQNAELEEGDEMALREEFVSYLDCILDILSKYIPEAYKSSIAVVEEARWCASG